MSLGLLWWHEGGLDGMPRADDLVNAWHWILLVAIIMLPITYLTIWPATVLSPGRVGMLLLIEVVVGVSSAAMLTDETFGSRELFGTLLIISAGVVEVLRQQKIGKSGIVRQPAG